MDIFFLRMDKESFSEYDLTIDYPYIHSIHGICGERALIKKYKSIMFPRLSISERELLDYIYTIKQQLIDEGKLDETAPGKKRCDLAIKYWLHTMQVGDAVFVRNQANQLFLCKVASYVNEEFFDENGCFQRMVTDVVLLEDSSLPSEILDRTYGRKTIERNACRHVTSAFEEHFGSKC